MIFGVLREIAVSTRVGNLLDNARALHLLAVLELGFERRIARRCHGDLIHRSQTSKTLFVEHDLFGKPASTFPGHALRDKIQVAGRKAISGHATPNSGSTR